MFRYSIVACARWESPFIAEWLDYHATIGFDHVYLYCNDDDAAEFRTEVRTATRDRPEFVSFFYFPGQGLQKEMYIAALERARNETQWVIFLDIDEFLVLRGCDNVHAFMKEFPPGIDSVHFNWVHFGNSGHVDAPAIPVLRNYVWRSAGVNAWNKHLTRASLLTADKLRLPSHPFWHGLDDPTWRGLKRINVLGEDMGGLLADFPRKQTEYLSKPAISQAILRKAIINHYALKSEADFERRVLRGIEGQFSQQVMYKRALEDGSYRKILAEMRQVKDTYLRDFSLGHKRLAPVAPAEPLRTVEARHNLWTGRLQLGANGRLIHEDHGSLGSYYQAGDVVRVRWDDYGIELFLEQDGVFESVGISSMNFPGS